MSYCQGCADTERALASLRASHQEVIRVVREWQEAIAARDYHGSLFPRSPTATMAEEIAWEERAGALRRNIEAAEAALAAIDLGGAE